MKISISKISYHIPNNCNSLKELKEDNPDWDVDRIYSKTGINKRYIANESETASDLAYEACIKLFDKIDVEDIDLLVFVTQSPDYKLPTTACIMQERLKLNKNIMAFDLNLGCSGFVYALSVVGSLIESKLATNAILICSETYSKYISRDDRTCRPLFSDAASVVLIQKSESDLIGPYDFGTDGSKHHHLIVPGSGFKTCFDMTKNNKLHMSGSDVFLFTLDAVPNSIISILEKSNLSIQNIDLFIFHQASKVVLDSIIAKIGLPASKVFNNYNSIGNTVSASIPIALADAKNCGLLKKGDKIIVSGFGVGLSWGSVLINWNY
jgi:3-oxoacyl-[acyl-carrier-protein] synthase-3